MSWSRTYLLAVMAAVSLWATVPSVAQPQTASETAQEISGARNVARSARSSKPIEVSATRQSGEAVQALLMRSDLKEARSTAAAAIKPSGQAKRPSKTLIAARLDALFVQMEAAALQADTRSVLESAMSLIEGTSGSDARSEVAGARMLELAANTSEFRAILPRIQSAIAKGSTQSVYLRSALIAAGADGLKGISLLKLARESGLITNWRLVGPFGRYGNLAFDQACPPERDWLTNARYEDRQAEELEFKTGTFELPEYFPAAGVLYAASTVTVASSGNWALRVESPGTLQVFVDGTVAISKDDRFRATSQTVSEALRLSTGPHRVVVKFLASATPFRVALVPASIATGESRVPSSPALAAYVGAARAYWLGDYGSAIEQLTRMRAQHESAAVNFLLAKAWSQAEAAATERTGLLQSTLALAPDAFAAESELALRAYSEQRFDDAVVRARRVIANQPEFEPALRVLAKAASALNWQAEAAGAHKRAAGLHPSCEVLQEASVFFESVSEFATAGRFEQELDDCAPGSLARAEALSKAGRHAEAAMAAGKVTNQSPLDRAAHAFLVRELLKAGKETEARSAAVRLAGLAPNSGGFRRMAETLTKREAWGDDVRVAGFADTKPFYAAYRRDGVAITKQTAERHFSGGPAVMLLDERVAELRPDGGVSVYVHKTTRVLDRDGILIYGEVSVPQGASLLELRTIKADGTIAEPEFNQHKATISMPALSPGDAIDLEYVVRYDNATQNPEALQFAFGSFAAPMLFSRFVVLTSADAAVQFAPFGDIPAVRAEERDGVVARVWERNDIAQSTSEVSMPRSGVLPEIRVYPEAETWMSVRDFYRDAMIGATRIGNHVAAAAEVVSGATDEAKLRSAYRLITSRIHSTRADYSSGDIATAETTLSSYAGSRTAAMLALAQAIGIEADVLMTRDAGTRKPGVARAQAYSRPLIVFHCREGQGVRDIVVDAESDGPGFGGIAAGIARKDALLVSLKEAHPQETQLITTVPSPLLDEHSVAEADVVFDEAGNLSARVSIRMGAARSAQMRSILSSIEPERRKQFFEQLAMRIFPGAADATGEVRNETDPDQTLEIALNCHAPHFVNFQGPTADLDQLAPALGLRKMYVRVGRRRTPLYIDTPLFETAVFHVTLPGTMSFAALAGNMSESNEFGSYAVMFRQEAPNKAEIRREFNIPVQVIEPDSFEGFSRFARRIDDAERQRLLVERKAIFDTRAGR